MYFAVISGLTLLGSLYIANDPSVVWLLVIGLWLAGNRGMEKKMETTIMGYKGTTKRIHSFIPS